MKVKEPRFFVKEVVKKRVHNGIWSWEEYKSLFKGVSCEKMIGESTVLYLYYYELAIKNIKHYLGDDVKIIIMLRDPVERAFSAYNHVSRGMKENLSFEEALKIESDRLNKDLSLTPMVMYKDMGLYFEMVKAFKSHFTNIHIILYDDFKQNTDRVVSDTVSFLGLNSGYSINTGKILNKSEGVWRFSFAKKLLTSDYKLKKVVRYIIPFFIRKNLKSIFTCFLKKEVESMSPKISKELKKFFKEDILSLEKLLHVNLEHWK